MPHQGLARSDPKISNSLHALQTGATTFNSLHLRVEADAKDWADIIGGRKVGRIAPNVPRSVRHGPAHFAPVHTTASCDAPYFGP